MTTLDPTTAPRPIGPSVWAPVLLVLMNAVPLVGVLFFGWRLFDLMLLYWLENGVIGAFTLLKILTSTRSPDAPATRGVPGGVLGKVFVAAFFSFHYGMFWSVHGVFVAVLFGGGTLGLAPAGGSFGLAAGGDPTAPVAGTVVLALASLVLSHGVSYVANFLGRGEDRALSPVELMAQPYARVVVLHVTILGGGIVATLLGTPAAALLLLVVLKTGVDLAAHLREHRRVAAPR